MWPTTRGKNRSTGPMIAMGATWREPATSTEAVYLHNAALRTLTSEIVSCQSVSALPENEKSLIKNAGPDDTAITMRQTILYPQGGGQPSDTGTLALVDQDPTFTVSFVRKVEDGRILHFGKPVEGSAPLVEGQVVVQQVDGAKRDYHSRLHTGGHIVGLAMEILFPEMKKFKANHFPKEACMEYEGLLYNEHKPLIQAKVDELVQQDLPILISWMEDGSDLEGRGATRAGPVRIASIGGLDRNPCGGTHVSRTSLVGPITVRKISRQKGISRVSYECVQDM